MTKHNWADLDDDALLKVRIKELNLSIEGSELEPLVDQLYEELSEKRIRFRPRVYLADEWFSPDGVPSIAVPFYLAHPRLRALEKKMMLEVEGGTPLWCIKLLRHEAGHCFDHAYGFSRKRKWQEIFGSPKEEYDPDSFLIRPYSRSFVKNIDDHYAQSHPDEDFAETFAVWLDPQSDWRSYYENWKGALRKLQYVDELGRIASKKDPVVTTGPHPSSASRLSSTLATYYQRRKRQHAEDFPDFYDTDLRRIFNGESDLEKREYGAARFLHKNRKTIVNIVSRWCASKKYTTHRFVKKLIHRCEEIDLRLGKNETETSFEVAAYLASIITHYLYTGHFRRTF